MRNFGIYMQELTVLQLTNYLFSYHFIQRIDSYLVSTLFLKVLASTLFCFSWNALVLLSPEISPDPNHSCKLIFRVRAK